MNPEPVKDVHPAPTTESTLKNKKNIIFAIVVIIYEILSLPIIGALYRLDGSMSLLTDDGGVLLVCITTILLVIGKHEFI
jgi:hypothetical protein